MEYKLRRPPMATVIVTVKKTREYRLRVWLALKLISLAARILDWRLEIMDGLDGRYACL